MLKFSGKIKRGKQGCGKQWKRCLKEDRNHEDTCGVSLITTPT
jgi:hypothetical protein